MITMFRTVLGKQILLLTVFLILYGAGQIILFKSDSTSWSAALVTRPWLAIIYFLSAHVLVEQIVRKR